MRDINVSNNSNGGDINIHIVEEIDTDCCISRGNICLKNMNYEGAFNFFYQATFYECSEKQLYYCYKQLMLLSASYDEKYKYLSKIFRLKTVKKTKLDIFMYILILLIILVKDEPYMIFFLGIIVFKVLY